MYYVLLCHENAGYTNTGHCAPTLDEAIPLATRVALRSEREVAIALDETGSLHTWFQSRLGPDGHILPAGVQIVYRSTDSAMPADAPTARCYRCSLELHADGGCPDSFCEAHRLSAANSSRFWTPPGFTEPTYGSVIYSNSALVAIATAIFERRLASRRGRA